MKGCNSASVTSAGVALVSHTSPVASIVARSARHERAKPVAQRTIMEMKARQSTTIKALGDALVIAGVHGLDEQAKALGLSRSTTWVLRKGDHKNSGLSPAIIDRMLRSRHLPPLVRAKILEYIREKVAGLHGHNKTQLRRFNTRLSSESAETAAPPITKAGAPTYRRLVE
jgi:hypothetical protein